MRTQVEFYSLSFPSYGSEEEGVNHETIYGKRLALYLQERLEKQGIKVRDVFAEDWGWCIEIAHEEKYPHFIGCANSGEEGHFQCFIEPSTPSIKKWFQKLIDTRARIEKTVAALEAILTADPVITQIRWHESNATSRRG